MSKLQVSWNAPTTLDEHEAISHYLAHECPQDWDQNPLNYRFATVSAVGDAIGYKIDPTKQPHYSIATAYADDVDIDVTAAMPEAARRTLMATPEIGGEPVLIIPASSLE